MKLNLLCSLALAVLILSGCAGAQPSAPPNTTPEIVSGTVITLPAPKLSSEVSLEEALHQRRSIRDYSDEALTLAEVSQLVWAAQGVTAEWGGRTAPSAGALYPLDVYLIAGNVDELAPGIYKYRPDGHALVQLGDEDVRVELAEAALGQTWVKNSAIDIVISAVYERTTTKYGDRGVRYVHMEAGHAAQNICLQATALGLGVVTVGAFDDDQVKDVVGMLQDEFPLYVIPVGRKT
jgi:SagB-type dehydrogenase family enzyme